MTILFLCGIFAGLAVVLAAALLTSHILYALLGFVTGAGMGFIIERVGVKMKLWNYKGVRFPRGKMLVVLLSGWGEVGMTTILFTQWMPNPILALFASSLVPLSLELTNVRKKQMWEYYIPAWLVVLAWLASILLLQTLDHRILMMIPGHGF